MAAAAAASLRGGPAGRAFVASPVPHRTHRIACSGRSSSAEQLPGGASGTQRRGLLSLLAGGMLAAGFPRSVATAAAAVDKAAQVRCCPAYLGGVDSRQAAGVGGCALEPWRLASLTVPTPHPGPPLPAGAAGPSVARGVPLPGRHVPAVGAALLLRCRGCGVRGGGSFCYPHLPHAQMPLASSLSLPCLPASLCFPPMLLSPPCRYDETSDSQFYEQPRFVAHIDDGAIKALTQ